MAHIDKIQQKKIQEAAEKKIFGGVTKAYLDSEIEKWKDLTPVSMMAMSLMSNAQELLTLEMTADIKEEVRTILNRAKYYISTTH